ncbi:hypothetical protein [Paraburkholderia caballeronis]|uniref:hypothetical protein n=1 Tax=Paraburkholderia caballeronis TaxID=416943 RepID=UPI001065CA87|nr:hypothetical protein [Paraburkholderia caballeronis]TDV13898.1 hypothetical protein C7408_10968 [Paraburkholderia caballeronis]TDV15412.1 hypothetical protein C7406_11068 [Paraburkholderia caballeronis]TDV24879.1 hypothetical protein C7404_10968 [Paraburkholderia caballeronis]
MIESFVAYYDPDTKTLKTGFIDILVLEKARINLPMELEVDDRHSIDDEFARRFGGSALLWFATQYPELRAFLKLTDGNGNAVTF